jgi:trehalose 6-phosphate phosphatase
MPHLLSVWPGVVERIRRAGRILLLLDYDGTLTPIVSRPEQADLSPETRRLLFDLKANTRIVLGVISGRSLADLQERVGVPEIIYGGNHGLEMEGLGESFLHPAAIAQRDALSSIGRQLEQELGPYPGIIVENKGLTLSVHYRRTPEDLIAPVENGFNRVVAPGITAGNFKITRGKMVLEVRPNLDWDKGKAIARIIEVLSDGKPAEATNAEGTTFAGELAVYFGDDLTDEAGFNVVQDAGGIAVLVGPAGQPTQARYRVDSPAQVVEILRALVQL